MVTLTLVGETDVCQHTHQDGGIGTMRMVVDDIIG
jgi:hypothetical protein